MYTASPLDSASHWLNASNIVYIAGAVLTFGAAIHVLLEKRAILAGRRQRESFWAEASVVIAATVSVLGTMGAIHFSNVVSHLKDVDLDTYKTQASVQIAQAERDAANANQEAEDDKKANLQLQGALTQHESSENKIQAELTRENKATEEKLSQRIIPNPQSLSVLLRPNGALKVTTYADGGDKEAMSLERQFENIFIAAAIPTNGSAIVGPASSDPVTHSGVHCAYLGDPPSVDFCSTLASYLSSHNIKCDKTPYSTQEIARWKSAARTPVSYPGMDSTVVVSVGPKP
jgi:hypothetical protein